MTIKNNKSLKTALIIVLVFIAIGIIHFIINKNIPIVRNSLVYGKIANNIIQLGSDFSSEEHAYNKPLGFIYLSLPFVKAWGTNIGLKITSLIVTTLWSLSLIPFFKRISKHFKMDRDNIWLFLFLTLFNPLVVYQFVSAYPDLLFALGFLWSVYFLDRVTSKEIKWFDTVLLPFCLLFSIWVKHNGFILIPIILVFAIFRRKNIKKLWLKQQRKLITTTVNLVAVLIMVGLAQAGYDLDLFNFGHNTNNFTGGDNRLKILGTNLMFFGIYLITSFAVLAPFAMINRHWKERKEWYVSLAIFIGSLWFYHGTQYNIRYYLAIAPFFVIFIIETFQKLDIKWQKGLIVSFILINTYTILFYNSIGFHNKTKEIIDLPRQDNLRLVHDQQEAQKEIDMINELHNQMNYNLVIYISGYYDDGSWEVWENSGLFDEKINIIYTTSWDSIEKLPQGYDKAIIIGYYNNLEKDIKDITYPIERKTDNLFLVDLT